ncbi:poly(3-hydroxybutyrate) depolymerase [Alteromonadaceae bacterium Bs31]|nr:poly(3-hydroxybutyrate) depolymerase [Alteromonadaceae bacterium Bs31]
MLYHAYELNHAALAPLREMVEINKRLLKSPYNPASYTWFGRTATAACEMFESVTRRYAKPEWNLFETRIGDTPVAVKERCIMVKPFCRLLHFERSKVDLHEARGEGEVDPRVLLVAPLSGHYATLLRRTVDAMLPDHEVYITDWADARDVPLPRGRFDLNDYIDYLMDIIEVLGPDLHIIAICQPGPAVLAAVSVLSETQSEYLPASMTIMGSPIDTRKSPTVPNQVAMERSFDWFKDNMIYTVPWPNKGVMRRVYPGFLQLGGFITMNQDRHMLAHQKYFEQMVGGDCDSVQKHREFYDEYLAVLDLTEEFYLQTIRDVFQEHKLAKGEFYHHGQRVQPDKITQVALMTVEGENDDISGIGQTQAAHDLCVNIPSNMQVDYIQEGVGHYGVFSGKRFRSEVLPKMRDFMRSHVDEKKEKAFRKDNQHLFFS